MGNDVHKFSSTLLLAGNVEAMLDLAET